LYGRAVLQPGEEHFLLTRWAEICRVPRTSRPCLRVPKIRLYLLTCWLPETRCQSVFKATSVVVCSALRALLRPSSPYRVNLGNRVPGHRATRAFAPTRETGVGNQERRRRVWGFGRKWTGQGGVFVTAVSGGGAVEDPQGTSFDRGPFGYVAQVFGLGPHAVQDGVYEGPR